MRGACGARKVCFFVAQQPRRIDTSDCASAVGSGRTSRCFSSLFSKVSSLPPRSSAANLAKKSVADISLTGTDAGAAAGATCAAAGSGVVRSREQRAHLGFSGGAVRAVGSVEPRWGARVNGWESRGV